MRFFGNKNKFIRRKAHNYNDPFLQPLAVAGLPASCLGDLDIQIGQIPCSKKPAGNGRVKAGIRACFRRHALTGHCRDFREPCPGGCPRFPCHPPDSYKPASFHAACRYLLS